jgi:aspartyl-tRNA(Asn)/glutamyl-tRNA(Gln) amidotransferase subunit A
VNDRPWRLPARALLESYQQRTLSAVEALEDCASRIEEIAPLNAFIVTDIDLAMRDARDAERRYAAGAPLPLDGVPVAVKDLLDTRGLPTAYGSAIYRNHTPEADAEAVRRVRDAGGLIVGKTNTHEFGWGITCENPHYGPSRNPWDPARVPGGSSGGSAIAVATGAVPLALGTDTGGSIRIPAAFCGVAGHKPTSGCAPLRGAFPLAPSLDHIGWLARSPDDAALLWKVLAEDACEPGAEREPPGIHRPVRVGICADGGLASPETEVREVLERAARALEDQGARLEGAGLPDAEWVRAAFATIQMAEALSVHRRAGIFPSHEAEYGADVSARLRAATEVEMPEYAQAQGARGEIRARTSRLFEEVDYLLTPVSAGPPKAIGPADDETGAAFRDLVMGFTVLQNLAGLPALAIRAGSDSRGLPVAVQLTAAPGRDDELLALGHRLQEALPPLSLSPFPAAPRQAHP